MSKENSNKLLIIIDDVYPIKLSSFRNVEFENYIKNYDNVLIINISQRIIEDNDMDFFKYPDKEIKVYQTNFQDDNYLKILEYIKRFKIKLATIDFLNNVYGENDSVLTFLETNKIKFVFTLYPGGGFFLNKYCLSKLKRVLASPMIYKLIITQKKILDLVLEKNLIEKEKISYIYGLTVSEEFLNIDINHHRNYEVDKVNCNICFVAYKYSLRGMDKGYDTFITVAKKLREKYSNIYFHVVGNFDENDINVEELDERIAFYGTNSSDWFKNFYNDKDIILSPTRPSKLAKGSFDGFPTGATTDAMLNGVMAIVTDPLGLNNNYKNNKDIIIVNNDVAKIVETIECLLKNPKRIKRIAKNGYKLANKIYSFNAQIQSRLNILKELEKDAK